MNFPESELQQNCIKIFRYKHPKLKQALIAVPNAARRSPLKGHIMRNEGMTAGVADLLLLVPKGSHGCLCIEMKYGNGKQSDSQKDWAMAMVEIGNKYVICRSVESFLLEIELYLKNE